MCVLLLLLFVCFCCFVCLLLLGFVLGLGFCFVVVVVVVVVGCCCLKKFFLFIYIALQVYPLFAVICILFLLTIRGLRDRSCVNREVGVGSRSLS